MDTRPVIPFGSCPLLYGISDAECGWTALSQAACDKGININPVKLNSGRHETNLKAMEVDAKTLRGKGFNPALTDIPIPFSTLLGYLDNLAPTFDDLKVILIFHFPLSFSIALWFL